MLGINVCFPCEVFIDTILQKERNMHGRAFAAVGDVLFGIVGKDIFDGQFRNVGIADVEIEFRGPCVIAVLRQRLFASCENSAISALEQNALTPISRSRTPTCNIIISESGPILCCVYISYPLQNR